MANQIKYSLPPADFKFEEPKKKIIYSLPPVDFKYEEEQPNQEQSNIQSQHPMLYKIAEMVAQHPDLQKWVNRAGEDVGKHIVNPITQAGIPNIAEHALGLPRSVAELITGREHHVTTENLNPYIAHGSKGIGQAISLLTGGSLAKQLPSAMAAMSANKMQEAIRNHSQNEELLNQQKAQAFHEFGNANPNRLELMSQDKANELQEAIQRINKMPQSRGGPHQPSEMIAQNANESLANARQAVQQFGGEGQNFPKRISDQFMTELRGEKNPDTGHRENGFIQIIGNRYNALTKSMRADSVEIKETPELYKLAQSVKKQLPELSDETHQQITKKWADQLTQHKKVNAADLLESYRGYKQELRKMNDKYYEPGVSIKEQRALRPEIKQIKDHIKTIKTAMDQQLPPRYLDSLSATDKLYSKMVVPLSENPIYQLMKKGKIPSNPLQDLSLDMPGNETLNAFKQINPEIQRLLFGHQFASKPENLLKKSEIVDELATMNPTIHAIRQALHEAQQNLEPKMQQAAEQKEFESLSHDIPRLRREIKLAEELSDNIRDSLKNKNASKEEVKRLEAKQAKNSKRWNELKNIMKVSGYVKWFKPFQM